MTNNKEEKKEKKITPPSTNNYEGERALDIVDFTIDKEKLIKALKEHSPAMGLRLNDTVLQKFAHYYELVIRKNSVMNLTAITEPIDFALKHILDSLSIITAGIKLEDKSKILDLGTGAGMPGIPLKIYLDYLDDSDSEDKINVHLTLMDSLKKRIDFLDEVIKELELKNIDTIQVRAEDLGQNQNHREQYTLVLSRAVAALSILLEYSLPLVKIGGKFIAYKSSDYMEELEKAKPAIKILGGKGIEYHKYGNTSNIYNIELPLAKGSRALIAIDKISKTPKKYPRKVGTAKNRPLV